MTGNGVRTRWVPFLVVAALAALLTACPGPSSSLPIISSFKAEPAAIDGGGQSTLSWTVSGAESLVVNPGTLDVSGKTSQVVSPSVTTTYTLTATNATGTRDASTTVTVTVPGETATKTVRAADGGALSVAGTTLSIPTGALNQDTLVTLMVGTAPAAPDQSPMQPSGPLVSFDLGGARLSKAASLNMPYSAQAAMEYVVTEQSAANAEGGKPGTRVHAAKPAGSGVVALDVTRDGAYAVQAIAHAEAPSPLRTAAEGFGNTSLQVPFYWQAGLPWCVPTSLAATLNYFQPLPGIAGRSDAPGGRVANWTLAGLIGQDAASGAGIDSLDRMGVPKDRYSVLNWDADLIPSAPFTSYVILATTGVFGLGPMRPVWTLSDRQWHAFVITGLSADGVYLNNSNDRWNGTHPSLSWQQFRDANCTLKDENDPAKGCSGDPLEELWTLLFHGTPRPETERRGSLELGPRTAEDINRTVSFNNPSGTLIADWAWDGNPFTNGYLFKEESTLRFLPIDTRFGRLLPRSSRLRARFNVVNTTEKPYPYEAIARVYISDSFKLERSETVNVGAYDREEVDLDFGNLASAVGAIGGPVTGRIEINLRQNGAVQDVKTVSFRLGPDPTDPPSVNVPQPGMVINGVPVVGFTTLKDVPITITGRAYDRYAQPNGDVPAGRLVWTEGGSTLGSGQTLTRSFSSTGRHTVTLTATSEYGARGSAGASVNVIDPVRKPGEVVIDAPPNNSGVSINGVVPLDVALVGHATYSDGAHVPGDRLYWTDNDGKSLGTGASSVASVYPGKCGGANPHIFWLTARTADGSPIGTRSVTFFTYTDPC